MTWCAVRRPHIGPARQCARRELLWYEHRYRPADQLLWLVAKNPLYCQIRVPHETVDAHRDDAIGNGLHHLAIPSLGLTGLPRGVVLIAGRFGGLAEIAHAVGILTVNTDPIPGADSALMVPPYCSTTRLVIARPMPEPSALEFGCRR